MAEPGNTPGCKALTVKWVRHYRDRRKIYDLHELLCTTFPSPAVALEREWGDEYVDLLGEVDIAEASLAGALSWGRQAHRPGLAVAFEQAVSCQSRWNSLMTETQRDVIDRVVDGLRLLVSPEGGR